jgi:hypothetical protein
MTVLIFRCGERALYLTVANAQVRISPDGAGNLGGEQREKRLAPPMGLPQP